MPDTGVGTPGFREGMWAVSPYCFDEKIRSDMHLPDTVQLMDMTLREGRQVAGVSVGIEEVLEFARRIDEVGVHIVEMHHDFIDEIKRTKALGVEFRIQALVHPTAALNPEACREEIDLCLDAGADIICPAFAISDYNYKLVESMGGLTITREEALDRACEAIQYGKEQGAYMNPNLMDFSRLDLERLKTIVSRLKEAGIDCLRIDDICGACIPAVYKHHAWVVKQILGPKIPLAIHSHNDFELGTAGQLAALEGGAEVLEGCINGLGERAGVPNLAVLAPVLEMMYGYDTGMRLELLQDLSEWVADVWNQPIPEHQAVRAHRVLARRRGALRAARRRRMVVQRMGAAGHRQRPLRAAVSLLRRRGDQALGDRAWLGPHRRRRRAAGARAGAYRGRHRRREPSDKVLHRSSKKSSGAEPSHHE